ncbi:MAG: SGNH/GDSL hydrolase family protein [Nitrospiraceae bacterium]|nr:MAG: SGNH/GDSL hydrolase family protein [Nitrospiraceae bacterium]
MDLRGSKKPLFILITIAISVLLTLSVLFIIAQVYIESAKKRDLQYVGDAFINYRIKPNQNISPGKGWFHTDGREVHINSLSLRGQEIQQKPRPGTFRIAVLGGSAVYDIWVPDNQTFTYKLQEMLHKKTGKEIEVINCGVPGWSTVHSLINYIYRIRYLKPDLIIVYHTWNDIKYFQFLHNGFDMPQYFSLYKENEQRYLNGSFPLAQIDALRIMFMAATAKLQGKDIVESERDPYTGNKIQSGQIFDTTIFRNSLTDLVRLAKLDGVSVLLATQANLAFKNTTEEDKKRIWYSYVSTDHDGLVKLIDLANNAIYQVGQEENVPVLDVYKSMLGKSEYLNDHVHLSPKGCEKIAELLSDKIVEINFSSVNRGIGELQDDI